MTGMEGIYHSLFQFRITCNGSRIISRSVVSNIFCAVVVLKPFMDSAHIDLIAGLWKYLKNIRYA
jgi:hypothetical protein